MTKTKGFWAAIAVVSLAAVVSSGYSIYNRLIVHFSNDTVEIGRSRVPPLADPAESEDGSGAEPVQDQKPEDAKEPVRQRAIKTRFEYKSASAKRVSLTGSFSSWKEIPLVKSGGVWKADVYILPGNYLFHFMVDGKKTPDPAKPRSPLGESIVAVGDGADGQN